MLTEAVSDGTPLLYPFEIVRPNNERKRTEVLLETFIRKQLRLKAHTVTKVEETDEFMIVSIDRLGKRRLLRLLFWLTPAICANSQHSDKCDEQWIHGKLEQCERSNWLSH